MIFDLKKSETSLLKSASWQVQIKSKETSLLDLRQYLISSMLHSEKMFRLNMISNSAIICK